MALLPTTVTAGQAGRRADTQQSYRKLNNSGIDVKADYSAVGNGVSLDHTIIQSALDAVPSTGGTLYFPPGVYQIGAALVPKALTRIIGAGRGVTTIRTPDIDHPAFDLLDRDDVLIQGMSLVNTGSRLYPNSQFRGSNIRGYRSGIWTNSSRLTVRDVYIDNFYTGLTLSNWNSAAGTSSGLPRDNRIFNLEVEHADFGILCWGQKGLLVDGYVCRNDIDTSVPSGTDPTHAFYTSEMTSYQSRDVILNNLYAENILHGHAWQLKPCDGVTISNAYCSNTSGAFNLVGDALAPVTNVNVTGLTAVDQIPVAGASVVAFQNTNELRCRISNVHIEMAVPRRAIQLYGDYNTLENATLWVNRNDVGAGGVVLTQDDYDIAVRGSNHTLRNVTVEGTPGNIGRCISLEGDGHTVINPRTRNVRNTVDIHGVAQNPSWPATNCRVIGDPALMASSSAAQPVLRNQSDSTNFISLGTTAERAAIASVPEGTMMFDTTINAPIWHNGTSWITGSSGGATPPDVQRFTSSGTWTKPAGAVTVEVSIIAGGGGGGSGRRGVAGTVRCGGGPGGGGSAAARMIEASLLGATVTVTVGTGGGGGAAVTTNDTDGAAGTAGGTSTFGTFVRTLGGGGGGGGTATAGAAGGVGSGMFAGAAGGAASSTGGVGAASGTGTAAGSGGGAGGGITSADSPSNGVAGGNISTSVTSGGAGTAGTTPGGTGGAGTAVTTNLVGGGGGGGGGAGSITGVAGTGGAGGLYGSGGGGGGASLNGNNSGAGGPGAGGICVVTSYF